MRRKRHRSTDTVSFQITPMIDMTFLLLIFFMYTTKLTTEKIKLDIDLPTAASALLPKDSGERYVINIDNQGELYINNDHVTEKRLAQQLKMRFRDFPPLQVYLRADKTTSAKRIKEIFHMASEAGASDIIIGSYQK